MVHATTVRYKASSSDNQDFDGRMQINFRNAVLHNDIKFVRTVLNLYGNQQSLLDSKFLYLAIIRDSYEMVKLLLRNGSDPNALNSKDLVEVYAQGKHKMAAILLAHGANPNFNNGMPLAMAAVKGDYKMVNLLCRAGADVNINKSAALHVAEKTKHHRAMLSLMYYSNDNTSLQQESSQKLARTVLRFKMGAVEEFEPKQILCFPIKSQQQKDWEYLEELRAHDCKAGVDNSDQLFEKDAASKMAARA